jgi:hypothetical protein
MPSPSFFQFDSTAMTFCCHVCGAITPVLRLSGAPKEFACTGCSAIYRISVERLRAPLTDQRVVRGSEYVRVKA